jgi:hypothetical protein
MISAPPGGAGPAPEGIFEMTASRRSEVLGAACAGRATIPPRRDFLPSQPTPTGVSGESAKFLDRRLLVGAAAAAGFSHPSPRNGWRPEPGGSCAHWPQPRPRRRRGRPAALRGGPGIRVCRRTAMPDFFRIDGCACRVPGSPGGPGEKIISAAAACQRRARAASFAPTREPCGSRLRDWRSPSA